MKVQELFEDTGLRGIAHFPKPFISAVYKKFNIRHTTKPEPLDAAPGAKDLKDGIVISIGDDGNFYALGYYKNTWSRGGTPVGVVFKDGKVSDMSDVVKPSMENFKKLMGKGAFFKLGFEAGAHDDVTRAAARDDSRWKTQAEAQGALAYLNDVFMPKFKQKIEKQMDTIFANLRKLDNVKVFSRFEQTDRDKALKIADNLDAIAKQGFTRETMSEFLHQNKLTIGGDWGRIPREYSDFVDYLNSEPNAKAKVARWILASIEDLSKQAEELISKKKE